MDSEHTNFCSFVNKVFNESAQEVNGYYHLGASVSGLVQRRCAFVGPARSDWRVFDIAFLLHTVSGKFGVT